MATIQLDCPHCGTKKSGFNLQAQTIAAVPIRGANQTYWALMCCGTCEECVVGVWNNYGSGRSTPQQIGHDPRMLGWELAATYPYPTPSQCPSHAPDDVKRLYLQAANAAKRGDSDASGAMSRKVVDVSLQKLLGDESRNFKNIYQRIEALAEAGKLTTELKDWAHEVRLGGADAAHDLDPFTQEEADELLAFAELFLTYVYTLPGRLHERRERAAAEKAAKGT